MAHDDNVLLPGVIRTGTLVSDNRLFPTMQVPIRVTEAGIEITISWPGEDAISRLWSGSEQYSDDPDRSQYLYEVPGICGFTMLTAVLLCWIAVKQICLRE